MANKVTGKTDTSGALSVAPSLMKSVMVVGQTNGKPGKEIEPNKVFPISSTSDAKDIYGEDSIIAKMVRVLITNGVDNMYGVVVETSEDGNTEELYDAALTASIAEQTVKVILFDSNANEVISACKTHLALCENEDMFRYAVFAPDNDKTSQMELTEFAEKINNNRIFVPGPSFVDSSAELVDGRLASAGIGALIMTETDDPALPMNGVQVRGFGGVNRAVLYSEREILANKGVTALFTEGNAPTIHRLVTTSTDKVWQEGTTRFIADYVLETIETTLRQNYKRTKNVARVLGDEGIRGTVKTLLQDFDDREIIENFDETTLTVVKDPADAYGALIDYEFDVVTPLYTITINQHMKL